MPADAGQDDQFLVQTPGGVFRVRFDEDASVSAHGGVVPFAQFLRASRLFEEWVEAAPLHYGSNHALPVRDILGSQVLTMVCGHNRFAHITALRGDTVLPGLLGMKQIVSEDSVRRALLRLVEDDAADARTQEWIGEHLSRTVHPLLDRPWTLDLDVTIKPLYGRQEGSIVGHNPHKPGRPSHALHAFVMAQTRLVLDVAVHPGHEHTSNHSLPDLVRLLSGLARERWPRLVRGDSGFGNEEMMAWCESEGLDYLFKQRMTRNTRALVQELDLQSGWADAGQGWEAKASTLRLSTWSAARRVVVLRRPAPKPRYRRAKDLDTDGHQEVLEPFVELLGENSHEYQVLVTSLIEDLPKTVQRYRDRADAENVFDEIKNQWGWGGFTSRTFAVSRTVARITALVYDWWSIFCRLADPDHHREAVTTRPTLLHLVVRQTTHANQRNLTLSSTSGKKEAICGFFRRLSEWLTAFTASAEQSGLPECWSALLRTIFGSRMGTVAAPSG